VPRKASLKQLPLDIPSPIGRRKIQKDDEWGGFAQVNVGDNERPQFDMWLSAINDGWWPLLQDELAAGLKLTLVWDGANDCFIASLTGRPDIDGVQPWTACLSARAAEMNMSLALLTYKHVEVTGGDWTEWLINGAKTKRNFG